MKIILLIVVFLFLGGCRAKTSSTAIANIDPCSLITKEEAAAALGGAVVVTPKANDVCGYSMVATGSSNAARHGSIVVKVVTSDSPDFQKFGSTTSDRTQATPISGVGDKAVLFMDRDKPDEGAKGMQILKGNKFVAIGLSTSSLPVSEDVLKALAAKALSRLP